MKLHALSNPQGAKHASKRRGCGVGSGHGKTSAAATRARRPAAADTSVPVSKAVKCLCTASFRTAASTTSSSGLSTPRSTSATSKNSDSKKSRATTWSWPGLVRASAPLVKILGNGELTKKVVVKADKFSETAVKKIEAAGWQGRRKRSRRGSQVGNIIDR